MDSPVSIPTCFACHDEPVRGVGWVLRWAASILVLVIATVVLLEFGYRMIAEHSLRSAADAGIREATLPRANRRSVEHVVRSRLGDGTRLSRATKIQLRPNPRFPSQVSVALAAPVDAILPDWLLLVTSWNSQAEVSVRRGG